ncbi:type I pullulanase [Flavilitoribacter nigricans]|uniref:Type I pullulanase n=1 Tax=Flavilitoribacter nigricans (strain ATCC 23147 / DSM 23189 / NBRC 102662 / NCIMB 1420 / SS-2) TaxID=1122177 RepID=A0A2D0NIU7_FLAN2|nr:type I pullulanase [Flavilitoribacter nigricans]PHN08424.1 type I pullulanase [Flavilitoribacter nigricans DSM 23189 = NBRC 102662]
MSYRILLLALISGMLFTTCSDMPEHYETYEDYPIYEGTDLGVRYQPERTEFRLWSPAVTAARVRIYEDALGGEALQTLPLERSDAGTWYAALEGDQAGRYYTFQVRSEGAWLEEKPDPYARVVGTNGQRGMIIDLDSTDPEGWQQDRRRVTVQPTDAIIYELHVRDLSIAGNSGIQHKGKFLGLTETGTTSPDGLSTGLDHIREMGVTHVHILPAFDFRSIDESDPARFRYNWGYDPQNYNVPEGTYSTDPKDGAVRIREFKQMVQAFHRAGIGVILDVVYNHTGDTDKSVFNQLVPGYYYRHWEDGRFSDASACGNETASERAMVRNYIIESVRYWAEEYHLDGFRFDLMGIHDIETMNAVSSALHIMDPSILVYGEGWTAGDSPLPYEDRALKRFTHRLDGVAAFSDNIRDGIKGHVFTPDDRGFASGKLGLKETIKFGIVASTDHPQIEYDSVLWLDEARAWAASPTQTMTYVSCHDNHTLWDRLLNSQPDATEAERIRMQKLAGTIVLTSQGISFLHAGMEMLRTKYGVENSFESPDSINQIDWARKAQYAEVVDYFKGLIQMRKDHPAFRMTSTEMVQEHLQFLETEGTNFIAYTISGNANGDPWSDILVLLNGDLSDQDFDLPAGDWTPVLTEAGYREAGEADAKAGSITIPASTALVLMR